MKDNWELNGWEKVINNISTSDNETEKCKGGCPHLPCAGCEKQEDKLECGGLKKFIVIKIEDVERYLHMDLQFQLKLILELIERSRVLDFKSSNNEYLVINTDEPYAPEIIEIRNRCNAHGCRIKYPSEKYEGTRVWDSTIGFSKNPKAILPGI